MFYAYIRGGYPTNIKQIKSKNIQISKTIEDESGSDITSVKQGDTVTVTVRYRHQNRDTDSLALVDLVPGGFELVMEKQNDSFVKQADYREDRVIFYLNGSKDDYILKYKMKATFEGKFLVPAAYIEDMYQLDDKAVTKESLLRLRNYKKIIIALTLFISANYLIPNFTNGLESEYSSSKLFVDSKDRLLFFSFKG